MHDLRRLEWDSEFFCLGIGSVHGSLSATDIDELRQFVSTEKIDCIYWFADVKDARGAQAAQDMGFRYVDTRLTFERPLELITGSDARLIDTGDMESLGALARTAHLNTRFFFDGNFDFTRCQDLYEQWLKRSFLRFIADAALTVDMDAKPAGYVTVTHSGDVAQIGLVAVANAAQGIGIGQRLVNGAMSYASENGSSSMRVSTQARNIGAQRLYISCNFKPVHALSIYHWWPEQGFHGGE